MPKNISWIDGDSFKKYWENWSSTCKSLKLDPLPYTLHKIEVTVQQKPKIKTNYQATEESIGVPLKEIGIHKDFLNNIQKQKQ